MNAKKFLMSGIAGSVVYFLLGYLAYGILFKDAMMSTVAGVDRSMEDMVWWSLIAGNVAFGFLLAYIIGKTGNTSIAGGAITGAVVAFLMSCGMDLIMHATTNLVSKNMMIYDVLISVLMFAITGAVIAIVWGSNKVETA